MVMYMMMWHHGHEYIILYFDALISITPPQGGKGESVK